MTAIWKTTHELELNEHRNFCAVGVHPSICASGVRRFYHIPPGTKKIWLVLTNKRHRDALVLTDISYDSMSVRINGVKTALFSWFVDHLLVYSKGKPVYLWIELEPTP